MITEIVIFLFAAVCGLFISGYAVHMFIGGLVSPETERMAITVVCLVIACAIAYMAWDVFRRRTGRK